jgi:hypothetical protein
VWRFLLGDDLTGSPPTVDPGDPEEPVRGSGRSRAAV